MPPRTYHRNDTEDSTDEKRSQGPPPSYHHSAESSSNGHGIAFQSAQAALGGFESSRAIANGGQTTSAVPNEAGGAGVGAGLNAYRMDSDPSLYTDPGEYNSTVVGPRNGAAANVTSTRPDAHFLEQDPYEQGQSHSYQDTKQSRGNVTLQRSDTLGTLGPNDSVSVMDLARAADRSNSVRSRGTAAPPPVAKDDGREYYEYADEGHRQGGYPASQVGGARDLGLDRYTPYGDAHDADEDDEDGYRYGARDASRGYQDASYYGHNTYDESGASLPLKSHANAMGYADDEYDEARQRDQYWQAKEEGDYYSYEDRRNPPSLFANNLQGPIPQRKTLEDEEADRGLMGTLRGKGQAGWGGTLEEQIERRRKGLGRQRWPILSWLLAIAFVGVFIAELIKAKSESGQAIQTKPQINPMLGPSSEFLISFGARFVPCMRKVPDLSTTLLLPCVNASTKATSDLTTADECPIYEICGLPNANTYGQSYRFITPMFLHAGFIHIGFNLLVQLTLCTQVEKLLSSPFYAIIYFAGGVGGNLLGGNFGLVGLPSTGASGAIYTCISVDLIDLIYNWKYVSFFFWPQHLDTST